MRERRLIQAAAAMIVVIGLALRLWRLAAEPLWLDEAYSAYAADHGFGFLWRVVPLYESHPPFYYSLLHLWVLAFGDGILALRLPGAIASVATLPVIVLAADEAGNWIGWDEARRRRLMLAALGFASLSLALVEMAREVRPYPLMILVYAGAILLLLRLARRADGGARIGSPGYAGYLLLIEALLWLHNLGLLYGLSLTLALAVALVRPGLSRHDWAWLAGGHALVALAYLPGFAILRGQATTWVASTWLRFRLDQGFADHVMTLYGVPGWPGMAALLLAVLAVAALARARNDIRLMAMLLILALLPVILAVALSLTIAPVFITRTMTPVAVPCILLLAIGATAGGRKRALGIGGALILGASMLAADVQARMGGPMQDWYRTVDWLALRFRPGDAIFAYPNEGALPLRYALRDRHLPYPIRAIPTDMPALEVRHGWHPTGTRGVSSLPRAELRAIAQEPATRAIPTIWLLRLGARTYDPGDAFLEELHRGRYIVRRWQDGPIDIVGLRRRPAR
jgi:mannosyltransferase